MSSIPTSSRDDGELLVVPESLRHQLAKFRNRVWSSKLLESVAFGVAALLLSFLTVYAVDRILDTPREARMAIFLVALAAWLAVPYAVHRWVWKNRRFEQLARLLRRREPVVGDQLLSVIELAENESEQARSRTLCAAAIQQVAEAARLRDLNQAAPPTFLRSLAWVLGISGAAVLLLAVLFPAAAKPGSGFSTPWRQTPRFTFTTIQSLPATMVVPHGESVPLHIRLSDETRWQPASASLSFSGLPPMTGPLQDGGYQFELPPQVEEVKMKLIVGDFYQTVHVQPKLRPELVGADATIELPEYLQRDEPYVQDVRSGTLSTVQGSRAIIQAKASRELHSASINGREVSVRQDAFSSPEVELQGDEEQRLTMNWEDHDGLAGLEPFELTIKPAVDELPSVVSQDFPRQAVVLDSEQINFQALAADDFGVKRLGISWKSLDDRLIEPIEGEKLISAGGPARSSMQVPATFSASALGIEPQPLEVRLWVEDYMPEHERVYSPPHVLFVLTPEQHAIWITNQLSKWHRSALDVRDKEMQLHAANERLRAMTPEELADEEMRDELRRQASLESANGRRLSALARNGEDLLRQAARNPEIGVGHLDRWAEMLQVLNDIGNNRMPSVSDLLGAASQQKKLARSGGDAKPSAPQAGKNRAGGGGPGEEQEKDENFVHAPQLPKISDMESSVQPQEGEQEEEQPGVKKKGDGTRLTLPTTTLVGPPPKSDGQQEPPPQDEEEPFDQALIEQEDLLAEFEKISEELNTILANLEGSTLVKRLKAASREQDQVAQKIGSRIDSFFGITTGVAQEEKQMLQDMANVEEESSQKISYIMDDMQSYFERRRMNQFKLVLDEMKESEVLLALQNLGEEIPKEQGMSIAQAEYWSDTLDRWAEDLVDPACSGQCPGSKTSDALPPSLILEVLKILEGEVNLREETRVAEQARPAAEADDHANQAGRLSEVQDELRTRTDEVVVAIEQLPEGSSRFPKEIDLLNAVSSVMKDATQILAGGETGSLAIAAETEAIELLLQCKRINPKGGGGGGASPGGGGTGDTQDSALALLGSGLNQNERREAREVGQATGETGRVLPEEFRGGLDEYFSEIEQGL